MSELPRGGAYTAAGICDYIEILARFGALSEVSGDLVVDFGRVGFTRLTRG